MANEVTVRTTLQVITGSIEYISRPQQFTADMTGEKGPGPGVVEISIAGTIIDLSEFTTPAFCRIQNIGRVDGGTADANTYVEYGVMDPETSIFYPLGEMLIGESYIIRLSRNIFEEYNTGTGTGTVGPTTNTVFMRASPANQNAVVEAFEV